MYAPPPRENNAAGGFDLGGFYQHATIEVWPENWPAVEIFTMLGSQWRMSMNGPTGLDYAALYEILDRKGYEGDDWWQMFDDIRLLEREALNAMRGD